MASFDTDTPLGQETHAKRKHLLDAYVAAPLARLRKLIAHRGVRGLTSLKQAFLALDVDNSGELSLSEFADSASSANLGLSSADLRALFAWVDADHSGEVSWQEILSAVSGDMSSDRKEAVHDVFDTIDVHGAGYVTAEDIGRCFVPRAHPDVLNGTSSPAEVFGGFLESVQSAGVGSGEGGHITADQLVTYYELSSAFQSDSEFGAMLRAVWVQPTGSTRARGNAPISRAAAALDGTGYARSSGGSTMLRSSAERATDAVLAKLRAALHRRGCRGIIGLQRRFAIMDDDGTGDISRDEFKKAMRECALDLDDKEAAILFAHFDQDGLGSLSYEEFLLGARGPMPERRLSLARQAFKRLDGNGNGVLEPGEIMERYSADKHPDVLSGAKSKEDVMREFLDTFDVGGVIDGKVTLQEFLNYYANVSASIDDDDYFELMIRNAWHMSGGEGWCANTANLRVLATHADGSQTVEELEDDLGLDKSDNAEVLRRLRAQAGLGRVAKVSVFGGTDETPDGGGGGAAASAPPRHHADPQAEALSVSAARRHAKASDRHTLELASRAVEMPAHLSRADAERAEKLLVRLRSLLARRGAAGMVGLQRRFALMDDDNSGDLDKNEFKRAMGDLQLPLTEGEVALLFRVFDTDRSSTVSFDEFLLGVRGPTPKRRVKLIGEAYRVLDADGSGAVDVAEVCGSYNAAKHPDVLAGRETAEEVLQKFLETFDVGGVVDGKVTLQEFLNYYANVSASIDDDDYFELMLRNAWHMSGGEGQCANTANLRVLATFADGSQRVLEVEGDLGLDKSDARAVMARLRSQGHADVAEVSAVGSIDEQVSKRKKGASLVRAQAPLRAGPDVPALLESLRATLALRGARGVVGVQRLFKVMDDDGSRGVNRPEFKSAMRDAQLHLTPAELDVLFTAFDANDDGTVSFDELLQCLRGPMPAARGKLVAQAFARIDADGSGVVDPSEVARVYSADKHPDVLAGKKAPADVMREFLETFDVGGVIDGKVTLQEFLNYYANVSASIDDDDYFELMIRNAWHLSGGEGWCANTANLRVLVVRRDGSQAVVGLDDDLGLDKSDNAEVLRRLRKQGLTDVVKATLSDQEETGGQSGAPQSLAKHSRQSEVNRAHASVSDREHHIAFAGPSGKGGGGDGLADERAREEAAARSAAVAWPTANAGVNGLLSRIRTAVAKHGLRGFASLRRNLYRNGGGNAPIPLTALSSALKESGVVFLSSEIKEFFHHFETGAGGHHLIKPSDVLREIRGHVAEARAAIAHQAFHKLDRSGRGLVDPEALFGAFDASRHPEVVSGVRLAEDVRAEFADSCDFGGDVHGWVSMSEFDDLLSGLSACCRSDEQFEDIVRSCFGLDAPAASAGGLTPPRRSPGQQQQQRDDGYVAGCLPPRSLALADTLASPGSPKKKQQPLRLPPPPPPDAADVVKKARAARQFERKFRRHASAPAPLPAGVSSLIDRLRRRLVQRGTRGYVGLKRKFMAHDTDRSGELDLREFKRAIKDMGLDDLDDSQLRLLFKHFDKDGSDSISLEEFLTGGVRPALSGRRMRIVDAAFERIDRDGSGSVDPREVAEAFDPTRHPDVLSGRRTSESVHSEFLDTFDVGSAADGLVTRQEFTEYYSNVGACVESDDYFDLVLRNTWHISRAVAGRGGDAGVAGTSVLVARADGSQGVEHLEPQPGLDVNDKAAVLKELRHLGIDAVAVTLLSSADADADSAFARGAAAPPPPPPPPPAGGYDRSDHRGGNSGVLPGTSTVQGAVKTKSRRALREGGPKAPMAVVEAVRRLKSELRARGARGIIGLGRKFRILDDSGNKSLDLGEFKKGMKEMNLNLEPRQLRELFQHFDADSTGAIEYEEFLRGLRDPLTARAAGLVARAFSVLDADGSGVIEPNELVGKFNADMHPDVLAGAKTADDVLREFAETFEVGGTVDGMVTAAEFAEYYTNIRLSCPNEDYFELMLRNAWHMSGGEGWCANTANLRVLATHVDGTQTVEEVQHDLGLDKSDNAEVLRRVRAQGLTDVIKVTLSDQDEGAGAGAPPPPPPAVAANTLATAVKASGGGGGRRSLGRAVPKRAKTAAAYEGVAAGGASRLAHGRAEGTGLGSNFVDSAAGARPRGIGSGHSLRSAAAPRRADIQTNGVVLRLRHELAASGGVGAFVDLRRRLAGPAADLDAPVVARDFVQAVKGAAGGGRRLTVSDNDLRALFQHLDDGGAGTVRALDAARGVTGSFYGAQLARIAGAFKAVVARVGRGADRFADAFDPTAVPAVRRRHATAESANAEFLSLFDIADHGGRRVSVEDWVCYHECVAATLSAADSERELALDGYIRDVWQLGRGDMGTNLAVEATRDQDRDAAQRADPTVEAASRLFNKSPLAGTQREGGAAAGPSSASRNRPAATGRGRGSAAARKALTSSVIFGGDDADEDSQPRHRAWRFAGDTPTQTGSRPGTQRGAGGELADLWSKSETYQKPTDLAGGTVTGSRGKGRSGASAAAPAAQQRRPAAAAVEGHSLLSATVAGSSQSVGVLLERLQFALADSGTRGVVDVGRRFRAADTDGNGKLDAREFSQLMRDAGLPVAPREARLLFAHFDNDNSGDLSYDEFLVAARGTMSPRRGQVVYEVFDDLDRYNSRSVSPEVLLGRFAPERHPEVAMGRTTADEVLREFKDTFDVGDDGQVTRELFYAYFENVSATVSDDALFESLMRRCWKVAAANDQTLERTNEAREGLSGTVDGGGPTTKVIVTHSDRHKSIEVLPGVLAASDFAGMRRALHAMGIADTASVRPWLGDEQPRSTSEELRSRRQHTRAIRNASSVVFGGDS